MTAEIQETPWYWEVFAACPETSFDLISFYLFEEQAEGIEEIEQFEKLSKTFTKIRIFFPSKVENPNTLLESINQRYLSEEEHLELISAERKEVENWQSNWQAYFKPLSVGKTFLIRPPWEEGDSEKKEIVIYPGLGFGTGYHESTCLALQMLEWLNERDDFETVIDAGTGSGILAIAALLLNAKHVTAYDIEETAILEVPKNMELSGLDTNLCTAVVKSPNEVTETAGLVFANINGFILEKFADDLKRQVADKGFIILSGIIDEEKSGVLESFQDEMELLHSLHLNEWNCLILQKK